jgi:N-acetylmuramoyl-L-alanine amidase
MKPTDINYIVIHCSATKPNQDIGYAELDVMHKARGWAGCGYHVIIRQDGVIEMGRGLAEQGAHVGNVGHNHDSWGVCLIGGLDAAGKPHATFSAQQMMAASLVVKGLLLRAPKAVVLGHRDLSPDLNGNGIIEPMEWQKQCPCFDVKHWWKQQ